MARPKKKPASRPAYSADVRERALEVMRVNGLAAAHAATGVPKPTLSRWAKNAQVDLGAIAGQTRVAALARSAQLAEATADRLEYVLDLATTALSRSLEALTDVLELDDDDLGTWSNEAERFVPADDQSVAAKTLRRQQLAVSAGVPMRDLVGVTTRAIHDLALLRGEATSRGEYRVSFAVPRPDPTTVVVIEQDQLAVEPAR